jgi:prepilin-type processing-associated H-X9-DG protein
MSGFMTVLTRIPLNTFALPDEIESDGTPCTSARFATDYRVNGIKSRHPGGAHVALADGAVRLLDETVAFELLWALGNPALGGDRRAARHPSLENPDVDGFPPHAACDPDDPVRLCHRLRRAARRRCRGPIAGGAACYCGRIPPARSHGPRRLPRPRSLRPRSAAAAVSAAQPAVALSYSLKTRTLGARLR